MNMYEIEERTPEIMNVLLKIWEDSVRTTHDFLSGKEIDQIKEYVPQALSDVAHLIVAEDESGKMIALWELKTNAWKCYSFCLQNAGKVLENNCYNTVLKIMEYKNLL